MVWRGYRLLKVKTHLTSKRLRKLIKEEQKRGEVLQRLTFINDLYEGKIVPAAVRHVGVVKCRKSHCLCLVEQVERIRL